MASVVSKSNVITEVRPGDRIDLIAIRVFGNSYRYSDIVKVNPYLNIWDPKPGQVVVVPSVK